MHPGADVRGTAVGWLVLLSTRRGFVKASRAFRATSSFRLGFGVARIERTTSFTSIDEAQPVEIIAVEAEGPATEESTIEYAGLDHILGFMADQGWSLRIGPTGHKHRDRSLTRSQGRKNRTGSTIRLIFARFRWPTLLRASVSASMDSLNVPGDPLGHLSLDSKRIDRSTSWRCSFTQCLTCLAS